MTPKLQILQLTLGPVQTNCYIVAATETGEAAVIDPGWDAAAITAQLDQHGWQCKAVLLTHAHFDHLGAAADLLGATHAPLAVHPGEMPLMRANGGAGLFGFEIRPCPEPDVLLVPGQAVSAGGLAFDVLFVPGHTPGHVAFYCGPAGAVFSGDVLFQQSIGRTDLPGGDYATLMRSIREVLFALPDDTVVCSGHGPLTTSGDEKRANPFVAEDDSPVTSHQ
jgi:hydroxyacylglutathione hydrolase